MIIPMKKVSLVLLNNEKETALKALRKCGLVHLEKIEGTGEKLAGLKASSSKLSDAASLLSEVKVKKVVPANLSDAEALQKAERVLEIADQKKILLEKISSSTTEKDRLSAWGTVNPEDVKYLSEKGIYISMYEIPSDKYSLIGEEVKTLTVNKTKGTVRFLVLSEDKDTERPQGLPPEAYQVVLPEKSTDLIAQDIVEAKAEIIKLDEEFKASVQYLDAIKKYNSVLLKDIEFENVFSGMECDSEGTASSLTWLTGYVPEDEIDSLKKIAGENSWALAYDDPSEEDNVPTKLKNNKFVSLIYPLTDFLGTVPGYHEYDISGWFLFFFTIFFAMIFGDGGYGALVTVVGLILTIKALATGKKASPMLGLVLLLGAATMIWGVVTCTWFGIAPEYLPDVLKNISVPVLSNAYSDVKWQLPWIKGTDLYLTTANNLQLFCFTLALIQLCVAHAKGMVRYRKSLKCIAEFGSFIQLIGMYYVVLSMVVSSAIFPFSLVIEGIPVGTVAIALVGAGFALSFIFANYEGSILKSILESVKNIISVLLGVVNVFSDIVSYIRLWAVGLAGAAISGTVNGFAGPLIGHAAMFIVLVLLLTVGHGLNMVLNLLSVIVHGVRLNTLEFSNHLGMSWSGFKYEPFSETASK